MRDWNLPRPLVRWLDAFPPDSVEARALRDEVLHHLEGLEARSWALHPLLAGFPDCPDLWTTFAKALHDYRQAISAAQPQSAEVLDAAVALEESVLALRELLAELPRITGHGALDEIFALGMSLARGAAVPSDALLSRLVAGRDVVVRLRSQAALFARAFPAEEEVARHLGDALDALEEGLGGAFVYLADEQDGDLLEQAMRTLASGGSAAMAALVVMKEVSEAEHRFSEDPVLEELFRAVEATDSERVEVGLIALDEEQERLGREIASLAATFGPAAWRERHVPRLQDLWKALEASRERLHLAQAEGRLEHAALEAYQSLAVDLDEAEHQAAESLPTRASLPDAAHLLGLLELMGAVYEERAPFSLLEAELAGLAAAYRQYLEHLEKIYEAGSGQPELEGLLVAAEELGEGLALLDRALAQRDASLFPAVWEALAEPAGELQRLAASRELDGLAIEPETELPPFFAQLRELWNNRLSRRLAGGDFMQALARARREIAEMERTVTLASRQDAAAAAPLAKVLSELSGLCGSAFTEPCFGDLARIERLGTEWQRLSAGV